MSSSYVQTYLEQVKLCFPILEKPERQYLKQLSAAVEERFSEEEPESLEAVARAFGPPQSAVKDYLSSTDSSEVVKRLRIHKHRAFCASVLAAVFLMAAVVVTGFGFMVLHVQNEGLRHEWPTYTEDALPPELRPSGEDPEALP